MKYSIIFKLSIFLFVLTSSLSGFSQAACTSTNYGGATVIPANAYPYLSPGTGITVTATLGGGVNTLNNFQYQCSGITYNCTNPAWWLNNAGQSITLTFSAPVSSFSVIVNGTNTCEEFYFAQVGGCPGTLNVAGLCTAGWTSINAGTGLLYNGGTTSNLIVVNNTVGATTYLLTHNGCGAGSRYALVDCWVPMAAAPPGTLTGTTVVTNATCGICDGTATTTPQGGTPPYTYSWNTVPVQTTQTATGLCPGTYIVNFVDNTNCASGADTIVVATTPPPAGPTITPAGPFCIGDPNINLVGAPAFGTWSGTGITSPTLGTFSPATAGAGSHQIIYQDTAVCGGADTITIIVNANASAAITPAGPFCPGDPAINLVGASPGGIWSGPGITNSTLGTFNPATAGIGTHLITYSISGSCGDTQSVNIIVNPLLNVTITPAGPFCLASPALNLTAASPGGTWSGPGITNGALGTFDPNVAGLGTHTITYTVAGPCGNTSTANITVNPMDDATITPAGPLCLNALPITLVAATGGGTWSGPGITNPTLGTFDPSNAGVGVHVITYTTAGVCGGTDTENIIVNPLPVVTFTTDTASLCLEPQLPFTFTNTTDPNNPVPGMVGTSSWDFGDGSSGSGSPVSHTYTSAGVYNISLTVTSTVGAGGCTNSLTVNNYVQVFPNPVADFTMTPNPTTLYDPTIYFIDQSYNNIQAWLWNIGGLTTSTDQNPVWTFPTDTGHYLTTLLVTDANGCVDSTSHTAIVKGEYGVFIPNAFSPDFDGLNDGFFPKGFGIAEVGYTFIIFDRWGELIFESNKLGEPWFGDYKGKLVPNGVYVWKLNFLDINGQQREEVGHVNILK